MLTRAAKETAKVGDRLIAESQEAQRQFLQAYQEYIKSLQAQQQSTLGPIVDNLPPDEQVEILSQGTMTDENFEDFMNKLHRKGDKR